MEFSAYVIIVYTTESRWVTVQYIYEFSSLKLHAPLYIIPSLFWPADVMCELCTHDNGENIRSCAVYKVLHVTDVMSIEININLNFLQQSS